MSAAEIRFTIPGNPCAKERPRFNTKTGRAFTPKKTVRAENVVAKLARTAMGARNPMTGPIRLHIEAVFPIPASWPAHLKRAAIEGRVWHVARSDLDNIVKLVSDSMNGIAFADDSQVAVLTNGKRYGKPERVDVRVIPLDQAEDAITPGQRALEEKMASGEWFLKGLR
jgi:Holliday junction resolvase RusA-like endonuclease